MNADVMEARRWIGTPYVHQGSVLGAGCDCLGLIRGVWRARYGREPQTIPAYTSDWSEPQGDEYLWVTAKQHFDDVTGISYAPGQVILFRMRDGSVAKHLGLMALSGERPTFIHAYTGHGVIESPLSEPWARRIVAQFQFKDEVP